MKAKFQLSLALILSSLALASCGGDDVGESSGSCTPACDETTEACVKGECVKLCGNGELNADEACDIVDGEVQFADKKTCSDLDMEGGDLKCDANCKLDSSECTDKQPPVVTECNSGEKKCDGNVFKECADGKWNEGTSCDVICDNDLGCIECTEGGKCESEEVDDGEGGTTTRYKYFKCNNNVWEETMTCESTCDDAKGCLGCTEGSRCEAAAIDDGNGGTYDGFKFFQCVDNQWDEGTDCSESCDNTKGCVCTENATKCDNGVFRTCVNSEWDEGTTCEQKCDNLKGCVECINGEAKCGTRKKIDPDTQEETEEDENYMVKCVGDVWQEETIVCENECIEGRGCKQCEGDAVICENGAIYRCENGFWSEPELCGEGIECKDETTCAECATSARKCEGNMESICTDGVWSEPAPCPNDASCNAEGTSCLACNDGDKKCEIDKQYNCVNSEWKAGEYCPLGYSCRDDGLSCGMCMNDSKKCEDGKLFTCKMGVWADGEECAGGLGCIDSTHCRECATKQSECVKDTDNEYRSCFNGMWDRNEKCQAGYQCSQTTPDTAECVPGQNFCTPSKDKFRCTGSNNATLEKCESTYKWTSVQTCPAKTVCHAESGACLDAFVAWNMDNLNWLSSDHTNTISPKKGIQNFQTNGNVLELNTKAASNALNADNGLEFTYHAVAGATNPALSFTFTGWGEKHCTKAQVRINGKNVGDALDLPIGGVTKSVPLTNIKDGDKVDLLYYGNPTTYCGRQGNIAINATYAGATRSVTLWKYQTAELISQATYGIGNWMTVSQQVNVNGLLNNGSGYAQLTSRNNTEVNPEKYLKFNTTSSGYKGVKLYLETYRSETGPVKVQIDFYANNTPEVAFTTTLTLEKQGTWVTHVIDLGDKIDDKNIVEFRINPYKASNGSGTVNFRKISLLGQKVTCNKSGAVRCTGDSERQVQVCDGKVYNVKSVCKEDEICSTGNGGVCKKRYLSITFNEIWYDANTQKNVNGNPFVNTLSAKGFNVSMSSNGLYLTRGYGQTHLESASKQVRFLLSTAGYSNIFLKFKVQRINTDSAKYLRFLQDGKEQHVVTLDTTTTAYQSFELPLSNAANLLNFELIMRVYGESATDSEFRGALRFDDVQIVSRNGNTDTVIAGWDFNSNKLEYRPTFGDGSIHHVPADTSMSYWTQNKYAFADAKAGAKDPDPNRYMQLNFKKDAAKNVTLRYYHTTNPGSYKNLDVYVNGAKYKTYTVPSSGGETISIPIEAKTADVDVKLYYYNSETRAERQFYYLDVFEQ